jgi:hypothetical protein
MSGFGHFSPHLPSTFSQHDLRSPQPWPGNNGQNSSHLASKQYFFTFSVPQINWQVHFVQPQRAPQRAHWSCEPQLLAPQVEAQDASSATARAASRDSESVRHIPIILMSIVSLIRLADGLVPANESVNFRWLLVALPFGRATFRSRTAPAFRRC